MEVPCAQTRLEDGAQKTVGRGFMLQARRSLIGEQTELIAESGGEE